MGKKTAIAKVEQSIALPSRTTLVPDPALAEAFKIFACGFKLGALYGFKLRGSKSTSKQLMDALETPEAEQLIYSLVLKETDFKKGGP